MIIVLSSALDSITHLKLCGKKIFMRLFCTYNFVLVAILHPTIMSSKDHFCIIILFFFWGGGSGVGRGRQSRTLCALIVDFCLPALLYWI